jgi:uncharacterized membrane protein
MFHESWVWLSVIAYIFFSSRFLIKYYNVDEMTAPIVMCFLLGVIAFAHGIWHITMNCKNNDYGRLFETKQIMVLFFVALTWYIANIFYIQAMLSSPNSGYVHAFAVIQVLIVFLLSVWLLHDEPSYTKILGMIFAMIGIVLLSI